MFVIFIEKILEQMFEDFLLIILNLWYNSNVEKNKIELIKTR